MENFLFALALFTVGYYLSKKFKALFTRKYPQRIEQKESKKEQALAREQAIAHLMQNLEKARENRSEIIRQNPKQAAHVLKRKFQKFFH